MRLPTPRTPTMESLARDPQSEELHRMAAQLPGMARDIIAHLQARPAGMLIACDRNARPLGRAIENVCVAAEQLPPSIDGLIHYYKVSANVSGSALRSHLAPFFKAVVEQPLGNRPRIAVLDDHISSGGTRLAFDRSARLAGLIPDIEWITLTGKGADYQPPVPDGFRQPWRDRPDITGIDYAYDPSHQLRSYDTATADSDRFYETIHRAAGNLALR